MARPQKQTVDYFPHDAHASAGDTLTVLESRFGNNGYAFWFKLLERLCAADGHYIDCRNIQKWQTILAKAHVDEATGEAIMVLLLEMEAIDKGLWKSRVIWCQHLVDNLADVYKNRKRPLPQKPVSTPNNHVSTPDNTTTDELLPVETPQSKVKESKVNNSNKEIIKESIVILPDWLNKDSWNGFLEMRKVIKKPLTGYACQLAIKKLQKIKDSGEDPNEVLNKSTLHSWQGIFGKEDGRTNGQVERTRDSGKNPKPTREERLRASVSHPAN
jgi:hypothetical protein